MLSYFVTVVFYFNTFGDDLDVLFYVVWGARGDLFAGADEARIAISWTPSSALLWPSILLKGASCPARPLWLGIIRFFILIMFALYPWCYLKSLLNASLFKSDLLKLEISYFLVLTVQIFFSRFFSYLSQSSPTTTSGSYNVSLYLKFLLKV